MYISSLGQLLCVCCLFFTRLYNNVHLKKLLIEREEKKEERRRREKHWFAAPHIYAFTGWFLHAPAQDGTQNSVAPGQHSNQLSNSARTTMSNCKKHLKNLLKISLFAIVLNIFFIYKKNNILFIDIIFQAFLKKTSISKISCLLLLLNYNYFCKW